MSLDKLQQLRQEWLFAKSQEDIAKDNRLKIENEILKLSGELKENGTNTICNGLKVVTKLNVSFDQDKLMELYKTGKFKNFPFEKTFKPVSADLKYLEKNEPEAFKEIMRCAITKPAKPAIKVEDIK